MFSRFIHVVAYVRISFPFDVEYSIVWIYHILFIHLSIDGHLDHFHLLAIVNNSAVNIHIQIFESCFHFFEYIPRSGIAGSYGNSMFNFLRKGWV